jgi:cytochrome bd ubiquinol oxidase subunit I
MTSEFISRLLFFLTASFHFLYPPISIGLGLILVILGIIYLRTKDPKWRQLSFFWVKIFGLTFAMGVATGVVMEFEFGTNWSVYSRFVGNVFGSMLAAEGIFAFFLEASFLGLMLFGGNRLGPRMWLFCIFMVAFGAHFSAVWIMAANSWMQTPAGFELVTIPPPTRVIMTDFWQVIFTPSFVIRLLHTLVASWMMGSALILSVSAWYLLKKRFVDLAQAAVRVALPIFAVLSILQVVLFGARQAENVLRHQPEKLTAAEGLWYDEVCAPIYMFGWVNEQAQNTIGIKVPCLFSLLGYFNPNALVKGLTSYPADRLPPINLVFQTYHIMIMLGSLFILIGLLGAFYYYWKKKFLITKWVLWVFVITFLLVELVTLSGWWTAEVGRQPWIVWNVLKTVDAVSPNLTQAQAIFSILMFTIIYSILLTLYIYLLIGKIQHGPDPLEQEDIVPVDSLPDSFKEIFRRKEQDVR